MAPGFLAVTSNPSSQLTLEEFHGWYEDEHIPLRLNNLKEFLSGARYHIVSTSSKDSDVGKPTWLAMYEIDDISTFAKPAYTGLRENRSEREKDVMSRIDVLVRITGETIDVFPSGGSVRSESETTGMHPGRPSGWAVTHGLRVGGNAAAKEWADRMSEKMRLVSGGWARTRIVKVLESGVSRFGKAVEEDAGDPEAITSPYFVVHGKLNYRNHILWRLNFL